LSEKNQPSVIHACIRTEPKHRHNPRSSILKDSSASYGRYYWSWL